MKKLLLSSFVLLTMSTSFAANLESLMGDYSLLKGANCPSTFKCIRDNIQHPYINCYDLSLDDNEMLQVSIELEHINKGKFDSSYSGVNSKTQITMSENVITIVEEGELYKDENNTIPVLNSKFTSVSSLTLNEHGVIVKQEQRECSYISKHLSKYNLPEHGPFTISNQETIR